MKPQPLDILNLEDMIKTRHISRQKHPTLPLFIYNYTEKAAYDHVWNNETLQCRGLIMDADYNIVSRPFPKFFNLSQLTWDQIPTSEEFTVTEKMDGSLGISYWDGNTMQIATRGSFISDQAKRGNEMLRDLYDTSGLPKEYTYLFEIIYPENRIVVDYREYEYLVLLAVIHTETGEELDFDLMTSLYRDTFEVVKQYGGITDFTKIEERPNAEGYVVHYPRTGLRFKIKFEEYKRLHKIITGVNAKRVWEFLSNDQPLDDLLTRVPDEFYDWITKTEDDLRNKYLEIEIISIATKVEAQEQFPGDRKSQAKYILSKDGVKSSVVFQMLDGKPYEKTIWKLIEPPFERPFKIEV